MLDFEESLQPKAYSSCSGGSSPEVNLTARPRLLARLLPHPGNITGCCCAGTLLEVLIVVHATRQHQPGTMRRICLSWTAERRLPYESHVLAPLLWLPVCVRRSDGSALVLQNTGSCKLRADLSSCKQHWFQKFAVCRWNLNAQVLSAFSGFGMCQSVVQQQLCSASPCFHWQPQPRRAPEYLLSIY